MAILRVLSHGILGAGATVLSSVNSSVADATLDRHSAYASASINWGGVGLGIAAAMFGLGWLWSRRSI